MSVQQFGPMCIFTIVSIYNDSKRPNSVDDFQVEVGPHVVSCDCIGFRHEPKLPCKHIFLIIRGEKIQWDSLPALFR